MQYVAEAGWFTILKRIPEAMGMYLPIGGALMLLFFIFGGHDLFHWTHEGITDPESANYDSIIAGKAGYLNFGFFIARMLIYFVLWFGFYILFRKFSDNEENEGGTKWHFKSFKFAAGFLVIFAVTSSTAPWDWVLSIDTHWFSTMFGWYVFASWFIAGLSFITLSAVLLKEAGYLNFGFFIARMLIYFVLWFGFYILFRKFSDNEENEGGTKWHFKSFKFAAGFLVIFLSLIHI